MSEDITSFQSLQVEPDLLQKVLDQLYKDVNLSSEDLPWDASLPNPYETFLAKFKEMVAYWYMNNRAQLLRVLYRVDVPQSKYERTLHTSTSDTRIDKLTELILNRVLQKVITRIHLKP